MYCSSSGLGTTEFYGSNIAMKTRCPIILHKASVEPSTPYLKYPIGFRLVRLYLVVTVHAEAQGGSLTRTKGDQRAVQVPVLALQEDKDMRYLFLRV